MSSTIDHGPVAPGGNAKRDAGDVVVASGHAGSPTAVIVDSYPLWLEAVQRLLAEIGVTTVGKTASPRAALELLDEHHPDLVVADVDLLGEHMRLRWIDSALRSSGGAKLIVLGPRSESGLVSEVLAAGAHAYVENTMDSTELAVVVKQVFDQSIFFAPVVPHRATVGSSQGQPTNTLTRREWQILTLVSEGMSNAEIAQRLWVTEQTVKFHLSNVYRKLGVSNRTQASRWVRINGIVDLERRRAVGS
jgi:DNA-binding NarL/FixJ family response regulator